MTKTLCCLKVFECIYNHSSLRTKFSKLIKKTQTNTKKNNKNISEIKFYYHSSVLSPHTHRKEDTRNSGQLIDHSMN